MSNTHKFLLYHLMEATPFDFPQVLFNYFATQVMKDKSIEKDIYHKVVLTKVLGARGVIRKFLYKTPEEVQDKIYFDGVFLPIQKSLSQEKILKMRLVDDGSFKQTPIVDESILYELHQKFGLNTWRDDQLDAVWEKATKENDKLDVDVAATQ